MCKETDQDSYEAALKALGGLISGRKRPSPEVYQHDYDGMRVFLERLGLIDKLDKLKVVHVAGTKGKGSTCAMVESILRRAGYKTGLFTSPHLVDVRERIRIDGRPISKDTFLRDFWWTYRRLEELATPDYGMAAYFRFLTLVGLRTFLEENVDVAILEVGLGGRLDATNCVRQPVVCGVSALGYDHMDVLGDTLTEIAREKAGIFKPQIPAFTAPQLPEAMKALQEVAAHVGTSLMVPPPLQTFSLPDNRALHMQLGGEHQLQNASLAVALAGTWEAAAGRRDAAAAERQTQLQQGVLPALYAEAVQSCEWPGRSQVVRQQLASEPGSAADSGSELVFYLDGAHTPESMATCAEWFATSSTADAGLARHCGNGTAAGHHAAASNGATGSVERVLLFNCMQTRDPEMLLHPLFETLQQRRVLPHHALFVLPDSSVSSLAKHGQAAVRDTDWQQRLASIWRKRALPFEIPDANPVGSNHVFPRLFGQDTRRGAAVPSLSETLTWLQRCARSHPKRRMQVLVTGSLYLVGDMLRLLGKAPM